MPWRFWYQSSEVQHFSKTKTMTTSVIDEDQRNIAKIFMTEHSIYFRPNMSTNFDLYIFSYFSLCLIGVNIHYFGSHI